jgi:hypothetical protein
VRIALTISAAAHVLMWLPIVLSLPEPLAAPAETPIMAEIVSPDELDKAQQAQEPPPAQIPTLTDTPQPATTAPPEPRPSSPPKREDQAPSRQQPPKQKATKLAAASAASTPPAAAQAAQAEPPQAPPQTVQPQVWGSWLDSALTSPLAAASTGMDPAEQGANLSADDITKFKAHLQGCWKPPERVADSGKAMVVLRVSLQRDGALTKEPTLLAASGSEDGVALMKTAMQAVRQCQPYSFLPAADYKEWKVLDLAFSPTGLTGLPRI